MLEKLSDSSSLDRRLMTDYKTQSGRSHDIALQASREAYRVLEHEDIPGMMTIIDSMRRVNTLYYGTTYMHEEGYRKPDVSLSHIKDIAYDLNSFRHVEVETGVIVSTLQKLSQLEFCFDPMIQEEIRNRWFEADQSGFEKEPLVEVLVTRAVWGRWVSETDDPAIAVNDLRRYVKGYINNLFRYIRNKTSHEFTIDGRSKEGTIFNFEEYLETHDVPMVTDDEDTNPDPIRDRILAWRQSIRGLPLPLVFSYMEALPPSLRLCLLDRCGYITIENTLGQRLKKWSMSAGTFTQRLRRAIVEFENRIVSEPLDKSTQPTKTIEAIVTEALEKGIYYLNNKVASLNGTRMLLVNTDTDLLDKSLTDTERKVAELARAVDDNNTFRYSTSDIAQALNMSEQNVNSIMMKLRHILLKGKTLYISQSNIQIRPNTYHGKLIRMRPSLTDIQYAALTPKQKHFFDTVTIPDENGRYVPIQEAIQQLDLHHRFLYGSLMHDLEQSGWIIRLEAKLKQCIREPSGFTRKQLELAAYMLEHISQGEPLGSPHSPGLNMKRMYVETGFSINLGTALLKKIGLDWKDL